MLASELTADGMLKDPGTMPTLLAALGNDCAIIRRDAFRIVLDLASKSTRRPLLVSTFEIDPAKAASLLVGGACEEEEEARQTALKLMLELRDSSAVREELILAQAAEKLVGDAEMVVSLREWLAGEDATNAVDAAASS